VREGVRECVPFFWWEGILESWCAACVLWHTVFVKKSWCERVCASVCERECVVVCERVCERVCVVFLWGGHSRIVVRCLCDRSIP